MSMGTLRSLLGHSSLFKSLFLLLYIFRVAYIQSLLATKKAFIRAQCLITYIALRTVLSHFSKLIIQLNFDSAENK